MMKGLHHNARQNREEGRLSDKTPRFGGVFHFRAAILKTETLPPPEDTAPQGEAGAQRRLGVGLTLVLRPGTVAVAPSGAR